IISLAHGCRFKITPSEPSEEALSRTITSTYSCTPARVSDPRQASSMSRTFQFTITIESRQAALPFVDAALEKPGLVIELINASLQIALSNFLDRNTTDYVKQRDVAGHNRPGRDHHTSPDANATRDRGARSDPDVVFDDYRIQN